MKPSLQFRLSQHMALTPQLQQSIRLLQLSTLELNQEIEQMLEQNPFLEADDEAASFDTAPSERISATELSGEQVRERDGDRAAIALALARSGHDVVLTSTQPSRLDQVCTAIRATGRRAAPIALDLREVDALEGVIGRAADAFGRAVYGIAKAGILQMTRMLAVEWAGLGIRVNAVAPGRIDTAARSGSFTQPGYLASALGRIPLGRLGVPEEVAAAVVYLAQPDASYMTGHTIVLDGGVTAQ